MRIISGKAGSIPLQVPKSLTRPTTDRVREALFSSLGPKIIDSDVLDLFAGCGALGLESLSRGASSATFVDSGKAAVDSIEANLTKSKLDGAQVVRRDATAFLSSVPPNRFDLIFADPPYARDESSAEILEKLLQHVNLPGALRENGFFILESLASVKLPEAPLWKLAREKQFGSTRISIFTPESGSLS